MSVNVDASGRRYVQVQVELPGTPEDVWQAIATGPGVSSWFMPAEVEESGGKPVAMTVSFGPGMEARSRVTAWDPPRSFVRESDGWMPGSPPMAEEWIIEARAGGSCVLRIVHSLFASTDDWDNQLEGGQAAWPAFLRTLQLYLTHFRGQHATLMQAMAQFEGTEAEAWETLTAAVGVKGLRVGDRWTTPAGVAPLSGVVEFITDDPYDALLRVDQPVPGIAALGAFIAPGGPGMAAMNFYLYGDQAAATAAREAPQWQAWLQERFPAAERAEV